MSSEPRAFATVDHGTATVAVAIVGRLDGRWRLLGATAGPAGVGPEPLLERVRGRLASADPALAADVGLAQAGGAADLARLACGTVAPPMLAVVAATERRVTPLAAAAERAGWAVRRVVLEGAEVLGAAAALADPEVGTVLAGASDPPGTDERPLLPEVLALVAAAIERRPSLGVVLAGGLAAPAVRADVLVEGERPGSTVLGPAAAAADGEALRALLDEVRGDPEDGRRAAARTAGTLAEVLERRVEVLEVGQSAGSRTVAAWSPGQERPSVRSATVARAGLVPIDVPDEAVDAVAAWLTVPLDRLRLRDRLRELALSPWANAAGDGALLRLAAARAALERLVAATPGLADRPAPDLVIASGGAWAVAPGPAVALALADVVRRPGISCLGYDHARLLAPLGTIEDGAERRRVVSDLRHDLVVPLGSVVMPAGLRARRSGGTLAVHGQAGSSVLDLPAGGLQLVDLPPGERAVAELRFRDSVDLGTRGRHVAVEVEGGLGGLLVDLRDVPLRLPDRPERRRDVLAAWQAALWAGVDT